MKKNRVVSGVPRAKKFNQTGFLNKTDSNLTTLDENLIPTRSLGFLNVYGEFGQTYSSGNNSLRSKRGVAELSKKIMNEGDRFLHKQRRVGGRSAFQQQAIDAAVCSNNAYMNVIRESHTSVMTRRRIREERKRILNLDDNALSRSCKL